MKLILYQNIKKKWEKRDLVYIFVILWLFLFFLLESKLNLNWEITKDTFNNKTRTIRSVKIIKYWLRLAENFFRRCPICPLFGDLQKYILFWGTIVHACTAYPLHYAMHRDTIFWPKFPVISTCSCLHYLIVRGKHRSICTKDKR